jgi:tetratricopeptide (TPR) repeat protein
MSPLRFCRSSRSRPSLLTCCVAALVSTAKSKPVIRSVLTRIVLIAAGGLLYAGCVGHRPPSPADRFFLHKDAKKAMNKANAEEPPSPSLEEAIGKLRQLMATARPTPKAAVATLETTDAILAAALKEATSVPTVDNLLEVGSAYQRHGLHDQAYTYYVRALNLAPRRAETHEALARLWRDWGLPQLGLGDAHRAVFYAPASASARNTLGTLLQALGLRQAARAAYATAIRLDGEAGYAFNNLCYLSFVEGNSAQAIAECRTALQFDPALAAAHNNLALTYAALGHAELARREFGAAGGAANTAYNMGMVYLAQRDYVSAADEFDTARAARPALADADRRARDARRRAANEHPGTGGQ